MELLQFQKSFFGKVKSESIVFEILDHIPDICLFVKNAKGQFIRWNQANAEHFGFLKEEDVVHKTDYDLFPKQLVERYVAGDREILSSGKTHTSCIELVVDRKGVLDWYCTYKFPLYGKNENVKGVIGIMRKFDIVKEYLGAYRELKPVIEYIQENFHQKISMDTLAKLLSLSTRQLGEKFQSYLKQSPSHFLTSTRMISATKLLTQTKMPMDDIARRTGFYDRSSFSKQFFNYIGMLPKDYRKQYGTVRI